MGCQAILATRMGTRAALPWVKDLEGHTTTTSLARCPKRCWLTESAVCGKPSRDVSIFLISVGSFSARWPHCCHLRPSSHWTSRHQQWQGRRRRCKECYGEPRPGSQLPEELPAGAVIDAVAVQPFSQQAAESCLTPSRRPETSLSWQLMSRLYFTAPPPRTGTASGFYLPDSSHGKRAAAVPRSRSRPGLAGLYGVCSF